MAIHSTVLPETVAWALLGEADRHGVRIVAACLTGGHVAAAPRGARRSSSVANRTTPPRSEPALAACGEGCVQAGALGNANPPKLCLNLQTYVAHLGVAEAVFVWRRILDLPVGGARSRPRGRNGRARSDGRDVLRPPRTTRQHHRGRRDPAHAAHLGSDHREAPSNSCRWSATGGTSTSPPATWPSRSSSAPTVCPDEAGATDAGHLTAAAPTLRRREHDTPTGKLDIRYQRGPRGPAGRLRRATSSPCPRAPWRSIDAHGADALRPGLAAGNVLDARLPTVAASWGSSPPTARSRRGRSRRVPRSKQRGAHAGPAAGDTGHARPLTRGIPTFSGRIVPCEEVIGRWVADGSPTWGDEDGSAVTRPGRDPADPDCR